MKKKLFQFSQTIFLLSFIILLASIIYGVTQFDMFEEGKQMLEIFWGKFTFIDIYVAFIVFFLWVCIRESSNIVRFLWFLLIMLGGSMSICLYVYLAIKNSNYDIKKLMLGHLEVSSNEK